MSLVVSINKVSMEGKVIIWLHDKKKKMPRFSEYHLERLIHIGSPVFVFYNFQSAVSLQEKKKVASNKNSNYKIS